MTRPLKTKLATLDQLDGRTAAYRAARDVVLAIQSDLGGPEIISTAKQALIENAAVLGAIVEEMGARWISGEQIDLSLYSTLSNTRKRLLESIGLERQAKPVETLQEYLKSKERS